MISVINLCRLLSAARFFLYIVISALYLFRSSLYISLLFWFRLMTNLTVWLISINFEFESLISVESSETKFVLIYDSILLSLTLLWTRNSHLSQSCGESRIMIILTAGDIETIVDVILMTVIEANWAEKRARIRKWVLFCRKQLRAYNCQTNGWNSSFCLCRIELSTIKVIELTA